MCRGKCSWGPGQCIDSRAAAGGRRLRSGPPGVPWMGGGCPPQRQVAPPFCSVSFDALGRASGAWSERPRRASGGAQGRGNEDDDITPHEQHVEGAGACLCSGSGRRACAPGSRASGWGRAHLAEHLLRLRIHFLGHNGLLHAPQDDVHVLVEGLCASEAGACCASHSAGVGEPWRTHVQLAAKCAPATALDQDVFVQTQAHKVQGCLHSAACRHACSGAEIAQTHCSCTRSGVEVRPA